MNRMVIVLAGLVLACSGAGAEDAACPIPDFLTRVEGTLTRVPTAVKSAHKLGIVVVGTGSSVLAGSEGAHTAYPARLQAALAAALPGTTVNVSTDIKMRRDAAEMADVIAKLVVDQKPDLVVWQTGTVDAMRGVDPDGFRDKVARGVSAVRAGGSDVILVNMQYSPRTETMIAVQAYADAMHSVAQQQDVPLFDRLAAMKYWSESGTFDLTSGNRSRVAEKVHDCLGRTLAQLVLETAHLDSNSKATRDNN